MVIVGPFPFGDVCRGQGIRLTNLLPGKQQMNGVPRITIGAVDEAGHVHHRGVHEPDRFQRRFDGLEVAAPHEDVHVLRVPHGGTVHPRHPRGHGVATGHGIRDAGPFQGGGRSQRSFADGLHGFDHPLP